MRFDYGSLWNLLTDKQMESLKNTTNLAFDTIAKLSKSQCAWRCQVEFVEP